MKRKMALFTIQQDEPVFLSLWLKHYLNTFHERDIYVLDHKTENQMYPYAAYTCNNFEVNHFTLHNSVSFDHQWMTDTVRDFHRFLLHSYETVMFAEVDELVVCTSGPLREFIADNRQSVVRVTGLNIFHEPGEPAIDWNRPLLDQREFGYLSKHYDKPLIGREPILWDIGFHGCTIMHTPNPDLINCHLHRIDLDYCLERHKRAGLRKFNEADRAAGLGIQYHNNDVEVVRGWFYGGFDLGKTKIRIPDVIKRAF